jgi:hypothetical protein
LQKGLGYADQVLDFFRQQFAVLISSSRLQMNIDPAITLKPVEAAFQAHPQKRSVSLCQGAVMEA